MKIISLFLAQCMLCFSLQGMDPNNNSVLNEEPTSLMLFEKYNPDMVLDKGNLENLAKLQKISFTLTQEAIDDFLSGKLNHFDPNVGENACQIRAQKIATLATDTNFQQSIKETAEKIKTKQNNAEKLISLTKNNTTRQELINKSNNLGDFLRKNKVDLAIDNNTKFLTLAYFLTKYQQSWEGFDEKTFRSDGNFTKNFANSLKREAQNDLQQASINFIEQQVNHPALQNPLILQPSMITELVKGIKHIDGSQSRKSVPCLFGLQVILEQMFQNDTGLIIKPSALCSQGYRKNTFHYKPNKQLGIFEINQNNQNKAQPVIVIEGNQFNGTLNQFQEAQKQITNPCNDQNCSEHNQFFENIASKDIVEVIFANAALHPQFPGDDKGKNKEIDFETDNLIALKKEYERLKMVAQEQGMCEQNMQTFLIDHIYPDTTNNILKNNDSNNNN